MAFSVLQLVRRAERGEEVVACSCAPNHVAKTRSRNELLSDPLKPKVGTHLELSEVEARGYLEPSAKLELFVSKDFP